MTVERRVFVKGDRVRLTKAYLDLCRTKAHNALKIGTVVGHSRAEAHPRVRWDGRKVPVAYAPKFLEKADA